MNRHFLQLAVAGVALGLTAGSSEAKEAMITALKGKVTIAPASGSGAEVAASPKSRVEDGDHVRTGPGSYVEIKFSDGSVGRLGPNSAFHSKSSNFAVDRGEGLFAFVKGKSGFTVSTPSLNASILGTTVDVKVSRNLVEYSCLEGHCRIGAHVLNPGEKLTIRGSNVAYSAPKTKVDVDRFIKESPLVNSLGKMANVP